MFRLCQVELTLEVSPAAYSLWTPEAFPGSAPLRLYLLPRALGCWLLACLCGVIVRFPALDAGLNLPCCLAKVLGPEGPSPANARGQDPAFAEWGLPRSPPALCQELVAS